jgi:DNA mismatch repair ATPase MutS
VRSLLVTDRQAASRSITSLKSLIEMHDWQHNIIFAPIAAALLWEVHLAWMVQHWRLQHGADVRRWLDAAGQFEAFSSLAAYHYERPADPFPVVLPQSDDVPRPILHGRGLGHPLIPAARMVRNDVSLTDETRLLVISGSNMSGKSTLLRTVGINTVMALAGAPVRAAELHLTPLAIGATLRIQDSLQDGRSRFYAEITRIREIADIAHRGEPLLFLLDELLHGTNSHDRVIGSSGILRGLVERGAIGLITTHDLALTALVEPLKPRAANVHFDDWFEGSEMRFDYTMKPGPVTRSNAVALMRAVGLDVPLQ